MQNKAMLRKWIWLLVLCFGIVVVLVYRNDDLVRVSADDSYDVWLGNTQVTSENKDNIPGKNGGYATYDPETCSLTFYDFKDVDYTSGKAVYAKGDLNISGTAYFDGFSYEKGICSDGMLTVSGKITVKAETEGLMAEKGITIIGEASEIDISTSGQSSSEIISRRGTIEIKGGTINLNSGAEYSAGITAGTALISGGNITITACYGIDCYIGIMKISDGNVVIKANESGLQASTIEISGGSISVESGTFAVGAYNTISLLNGMGIIEPVNAKIVNATGGWAGIYETENNGNEVKKIEIGIVSNNPSKNEEKYDVWLGNTQVTSENKDSIPGKNGGYATYDPETHSLTFYDFKDVDYTSGKAVYAKGDLNISGTAYFDGLSYEKGICSDGTLTVAGNYKIKAETEGLMAEKGITIIGEASEINISTLGQSSSGIISRRGTIEIKGGTINLNSGAEYSAGITAGTALISGGNITITACYGIDCYIGIMKISDGNVVIKANESGLQASTIEISGGSISVESGTFAVGAYNTISLLNGMGIIEPVNAKIVNATGGWAGIYEAEDNNNQVKKAKIQKSSNITTPTPDVVTPTPDIVTPTPDIITPTPDIVTSTPDVVTPTPEIEVTGVPITDIPVVTPTPEITTPLTPYKKGDLITDKSDGSVYIITSVKLGSETVSLKQPGKEKGKFVVADIVTIDNITFKVTGVYKGAFKNYTSITSVKLGKYIKSIGVSSFEGCTGLKTFTMNSKITKISDRSFYGCKSLTKLTIPASVTSIGKDVFRGCSSLSKLYIKTEKLTSTSIGKNAFKNLNSSVKIYVPKSVKSKYLKLLTSKGYSKKKKLSVIKG